MQHARQPKVSSHRYPPDARIPQLRKYRYRDEQSPLQEFRSRRCIAMPRPRLVALVVDHHPLVAYVSCVGSAEVRDFSDQLHVHYLRWLVTFFKGVKIVRTLASSAAPAYKIVAVQYLITDNDCAINLCRSLADPSSPTRPALARATFSRSS